MHMNNSKKNIAFFGTPDFVCDFLDVLHTTPYAPSCIITGPEVQKGRGMKFHNPLPKIWADKYGIPVLQPKRLDDSFFETLSEQKWDLFIVIAYGKILPEKLINLPTHKTINLHYSLLPAYRGASPVEQSILHGDTETGISIQQMEYTLDTGPLLYVEKMPISEHDTTATLRGKLNRRAQEIFIPFLDDLFLGTITPKAQSDTGVSYCTKIKKEDGLLDDTHTDQEKWRKYRAYTPWPGVWHNVEKNNTFIRVKIKEAQYENGVFTPTILVPENTNPLSKKEYDLWLRS